MKMTTISLIDTSNIEQKLDIIVDDNKISNHPNLDKILNASKYGWLDSPNKIFEYDSNFHSKESIITMFNVI